MIVGDAVTLHPGDVILYNHLQSLGYTVTLLTDDIATPADANGQDVVYVSTTTDSNVLGTAMRNVFVPVIISESNLYGYMGMTGTTQGIDFGETDSLQNTMQIVDPAHPLAAGFSGLTTVYTAQNHLRWGLPTSSADVIALTDDGNSRIAFFAYESGASMVGLNAPARRVGFFLATTSGANLNSTGFQILDATISWAIGP